MANGVYANLNNQDYWLERSEERVSSHWKKEGNVEKRLIKEYQLAATDIKKEISDLFTKYSIENGLTYADSIKLLSSTDLADYKTVIEAAKARIKLVNPDSPAMADLDRLMASNNLTRLQAKVNQIEARLLEMGEVEQLTIEDTLSETYESNYYQSIFEIQNGIGFGMSFNKLNERAIRTAISYPWSGSMFSDNIWDNKRLLVKQLKKTVTNGLIRGEGYRKIAKNLENNMNAGYSNSLRLIRTETAHVVAESTAKGWEELDGIVSQYIFMSTLDNKTSKVCQHLDARVFDLKDRQVGVNYFPMHPNCRSTAGAWFSDDKIEEITRIARGEDGKNYKVQGINYEEWFKQYVKQ